MLNVVCLYMLFIFCWWCYCSFYMIFYFCSLNTICASLHIHVLTMKSIFFLYIFSGIYLPCIYLFKSGVVFSRIVCERVMNITCRMEPFFYSLFFCGVGNSGWCKNADMRNRVGRFTVLFAEADFRSVWLLVMPEPKPTDGMSKESGGLEFFLCAALGQSTLTVWQPVPGKKNMAWWFTALRTLSLVSQAWLQKKPHVKYSELGSF